MSHPVLLFLIFVFFCYTYGNIHACNQSERDTLLSFASALSSPPLNWTSVNCCHWEGISCNRDGWVTHLRLPSKGLKLKGNILSSSLENLTHLNHLNLSHNSIYGSLDQTRLFFPSSYLEVLDLSYNLLFGELPLSIPSSNMRLLDLSSNHFHGEIPLSFFLQGSNLTSFNVSNNTFSGSIPSFVCPHSSPLISVLDFSFNQFNGSISGGLGECSKLRVFRAGHNNLSGLLPEDMCNATTLEEVALPLNSLDGAISDRLVNLTNLTILDLASNKLSGTLPLDLGKLSKLKLVLLDFNFLEGHLPPSLMDCTDLVELRMGDNNLGGDISTLNFSKLRHLSKLDLRKNNFSGIFPKSMYSCKSLKAIRLHRNNLEGEIQPEILSLKLLSFLSVGYNRWRNITGALKILMHSKSLVFLSFASSFRGEEIPADLGRADINGFQNLRFLSLGCCKLTGQLPVWLSGLKKLEIMQLGHNRITGSIPSWLATLPRLSYIGLENNLISGEFPKELCRLPMLLTGRNATQVDNNDLELPIYAAQGSSFVQYKFLYYPPGINIAKNTMNGSIPTEIGQLQLLYWLDLRSNNFSGNIPDHISKLRNLFYLDLAMNHLSGNIPASLTSLNFLSYFNVSYNDLEGPIPTGTQLQILHASAFEGNERLCGAPLLKECQLFRNKGIDEEPNKNSHDAEINGDHDQFPWFHISVALGFILGFWGVCGSLLLKEKWRYAYFRFLEKMQDRLYVMIITPI